MISVIIPTYNCAERISEAIDSVLAQTCRDFEIIIVDDGSTDDTKNVVTRYINVQASKCANAKTKIKYFYQNNKGPAAARNRGIKEAKGEHFAFLDADDLWEKEKLEKSINFMEEKGFDWVATASKKITMQGKLLKERKMKPDAHGYDSTTGELYDLQKRFFSYHFSIPIHVQTFVVQRKCFDKAGLFDESILINEDKDLVARFQAEGLRGGFLNELLTIYRYRESSITKDGLTDTVDQSYRAARKHAKRLGLDNPLIRKDYANFLWEVAGRYYVKKKWLRTIKFMMLSFLCRPNLTKITRIKEYLAKRLSGAVFKEKNVKSKHNNTNV